MGLLSQKTGLLNQKTKPTEIVMPKTATRTIAGNLGVPQFSTTPPETNAVTALGNKKQIQDTSNELATSLIRGTVNSALDVIETPRQVYDTYTGNEDSQTPYQPLQVPGLPGLGEVQSHINMTKDYLSKGDSKVKSLGKGLLSLAIDEPFGKVIGAGLHGVGIGVGAIIPRKAGLFNKEFAPVTDALKDGDVSKAKEILMPKTNTNTLLEEAKKYKSAEEFVMKAKIDVPLKEIIPSEGHTPDAMKGKLPAKGYEKEPIRVEINKDGKLQIQDGNRRYYQALERGDKTIKVVFNDQAPMFNFEGEFDRLTDLYNQAKGEAKNPNDNLAMLQTQKEAIENTGFKTLQKYESKSGEFKGQLNINNGTGKFSKEYDTRLREVFNDVDNKYSSEELIQKYEDLKANYKRIDEQIAKEETTLRAAVEDTRLRESQRLEDQTRVPHAENGLQNQRAYEQSTPESEMVKMDSQQSVKTQQELAQGKTRVPNQVYNAGIDLPPAGGASLPQILDSLSTDVKSKVNILDYIRTPDRVLTKLGFGEEAKQIRKAYEGYTKELPKNIEKVTEWSKQVPKESNERIFKYLDGKEVTITTSEKVVADEIKTWLKEWADRLNLPEEKRFSNYITHIFDEDFIKKEFDEDLAKIIADKIPGEVYDPFLQQRLGKLGYKQDTWAALDAYVKRATRKVHMDPVLDTVQRKAGVQVEFSRLEQSQFNYIKHYIDNINMRPSWVDNIIDNGIKSTFVGYKGGQRPLNKFFGALRKWTYRAFLGLNPASALRNLSQGVNTYAVLGEKYTPIGYAKLFSKGAMQELKDTGVLAEQFIQDRAAGVLKDKIKKVDDALFIFFETAERINRGAAYFGGKSKALAEGKTLEEAIEYGKEVVRKTQFSFTPVDTPVGFQSDIIKTLLQFQTFTVKQTEFLTEMVMDKNFMGLIRYALGGYVFVTVAGEAIGMEPKQLIPTFRFGTPPSLGLGQQLVSAAVDAPDKYGNARDLKTKGKDVLDAARGLLPAGSQIKKVIEGGEVLRKGGSFDKGGNLQYEAPQTTAGKAKLLIFGKNNSDNAQTYFNRKEDSQKEIDKIQPYYDKIQELKKAGKNQEAIDLYDTLGENGQTVYARIKSQATAEATKLGKQELLPTFQKIRKLKEDGKTDEAIQMYDALTDDQKKYYQLLKKQLEGKPVSQSSLGKNVLGALGVQTASASEGPTLPEPERVAKAIEKVHADAAKIAPQIHPSYIKALVKQESTNGTNATNRNLDQGKYGWLVGFTKPTWEGIIKDSKKSQKYKNLLASMPGFDTPEDAMKSALLYSQFIMRDHTKEQETGKREYKKLTATQLYKKYNGNASPKGITLFEKYFND